MKLAEPGQLLGQPQGRAAQLGALCGGQRRRIGVGLAGHVQHGRRCQRGVLRQGQHQVGHFPCLGGGRGREADRLEHVLGMRERVTGIRVLQGRCGAH